MDIKKNNNKIRSQLEEHIYEQLPRNATSDLNETDNMQERRSSMHILPSGMADAGRSVETNVASTHIDTVPHNGKIPSTLHPYKNFEMQAMILAAFNNINNIIRLSIQKPETVSEVLTLRS